jgi:superoxide dismutase
MTSCRADIRATSSNNLDDRPRCAMPLAVIPRRRWRPGATPILALDMYEHPDHLDFGAKGAAYVDQVMANLNWQRIGAWYRLAIGEGAGEDELFLPFGAPAQDETLSARCASG